MMLGLLVIKLAKRWRPQFRGSLQTGRETRIGACLAHRLAVEKMELSGEHLRAMMFYDFKSGLTAVESLGRLQTALGESAPSRTQVFWWFGEFRRGRTTLKDDVIPGRPSTAVTEENVALVRKLIEENPRVTYKEIEEVLGIGSPAVNRILHQGLGVRKVSSRWVPHSLKGEQKEARMEWCQYMIAKFQNPDSRRVADIITGDESWIYQYDPETKQQSAVWVFPGDAPPTKVKRPRSVGRQMVASFFARWGHVATVVLEDRR